MNDVGGTVGTVALDAIPAGSVVETLAVGAVVVELEITGEFGGVVVDTGMVLAGTAVVDVVAMLVEVELVVDGNVVVLVEVVEVVVVVVVGAIEFDSEETFVGINRSTDVPSPIAPYQLFPQQFRLPLLRSAQLWASPDVIAMTPLERPNT